MAFPTINLLQAKGTLPAHIAAIEGQIRTISYVALVCVLGAGLFIGTALFLLSRDTAALEESQKTLMGQIVQESRKEGMYTSLKQRLALADKIFSLQRSYGPLIDTIGMIALPPKLITVSLDDQKKVNISIQAETLEELASAVSAVVQLVIDKKIINPNLITLQVNKDGGAQIELSFLPIL